jgi:hypothetical protein
MNNKTMYAILLTSFSLLSAQEKANSCSPTASTTKPWFTGSLTPSGTIPDVGEVNLGLDISIKKYDANIDEKGTHTKTKSPSYQINPELSFVVGLFPRLAVAGSTQAMFNWKGKADPLEKENISSTNWGDSKLGLRFALIPEEQDSIPSAVLDASILLPTGKYKNLDKKLDNLDSTSNGVYRLGFQASISKSFLETSEFPIRLHLAQKWNLPTTRNLDGSSKYDGDPASKWRIEYNHGLTTIGGFEISSESGFEIMTDIKYSWEQKRNELIGDMSNMIPAKKELLFAHGLGYNFNENFGMSGIFEYLVFGRNTVRSWTVGLSFGFNF